MNRERMLFELILLLLILALSACSIGVTQIAQPTYTQFPTYTSYPTYTQIPTERFTNTPKPTDTPSPTFTPSSTKTSEPTNPPQPTNTLGPTNTQIPTNTATPIPTIINVPALIGKTKSEVESVLGSTTEINPITDPFDPLSGGEYRDYYIGDLWFDIAYDSGGIARVFDVLGGLESLNYSPSQWARILPLYGVNNAPRPDRESSGSVFWNNYNGLFIAIVGNPVYTIQIDQYQYAP
jgi:hypothetical protein